MRLDPDDPRREVRKLPPSTPLLDRVLLRTTVDPAGCWRFGGALDAGGYGMVRMLGVNHRAHVVTFEAAGGTRAPGEVIDHRCRVRSCCNPAHLEAVTNGVNTRDRARHSSNGLPVVDYCKRGHERTPENTYTRPDGKGTNCRPCIEQRGRRNADVG